jgi:hypothetical protein
MECYNRFQFYISQTKTYDTAGGSLGAWNTLNGSGWVINDATQRTDFLIQGFKNINLYGIKLIGTAYTPVATAAHAILEDYSLNFSLTAQTPSISGVYTINDYNAVSYTNEVRLSRFQNEIMFLDPIRSLTNISFNIFSAQGYSPQLLTDVRLSLNFTIYFFYKYEGEDLAFL